MTAPGVCEDRERCRNRHTWRCAYCDRNPDRPQTGDYLYSVDPTAERRNIDVPISRPGCCAQVKEVGGV